MPRSLQHVYWVAAGIIPCKVSLILSPRGSEYLHYLRNESFTSGLHSTEKIGTITSVLLAKFLREFEFIFARLRTRTRIAIYLEVQTGLLTKSDWPIEESVENTKAYCNFDVCTETLFVGVCWDWSLSNQCFSFENELSNSHNVFHLSPR